MTGHFMWGLRASPRKEFAHARNAYPRTYQHVQSRAEPSLRGFFIYVRGLRLVERMDEEGSRESEI